MKNKFIQDYLEMHKKFDFNKPDTITIPDNSMIETRLNFLLEELYETAKAFGCCLQIIEDPLEIKFVKDESMEVSVAGVIDGLVDLQYVIMGTAAFCGLLNNKDESQTLFEWAWGKVHEANMKKVRVKNAEESSRNTAIDLRKPEGWLAPDFKEIL